MRKEWPKPLRGETATWKGYLIRCMGVVDNYVMARRPGCAPFVLSLRDWAKLKGERRE